jgi:hypothetical protein
MFWLLGVVTTPLSFFTGENGLFDETLILDRSYDTYALSGRTLITMNDNQMYSMNMTDCLLEQRSQAL